MALENLSTINEEKFTVEIDSESGSPRINFRGTIDLADPGIVLTPFFNVLHGAVVEDGKKDLVFDISGLDYINSSGIKAVIKYVLAIVFILFSSSLFGRRRDSPACPG